MPYNLDALNYSLGAAHAQAQLPQERRRIPLKQIRPYELEGDVVTTYDVGGLQPSVSATRGLRRQNIPHTYMEDSHAVCSTAQRNPQEAVTFTENLYDRLHNRIVTELRASETLGQSEGGAVSTTAYVGSDHTITLANAGDARIVLYLRRLSQKHVQSFRLTRDHTLKDRDEWMRVGASGGRVRRPDMFSSYHVVKNDGVGMLEPTRSVGELDYPGVTHKPEMTQVNVADYVRDPDKEVYLHLSSDGQYAKMHEENLAQIMVEHLADQPNTQGCIAMPELFTSAAMKSGSRDNITSLMVQVKPEQTQDLLLNVNDGHRGTYVANRIAELIKEMS